MPDFFNFINYFSIFKSVILGGGGCKNAAYVWSIPRDRSGVLWFISLTPDATSPMAMPKINLNKLLSQKVSNTTCVCADGDGRHARGARSRSGLGVSALRSWLGALVAGRRPPGAGGARARAAGGRGGAAGGGGFCDTLQVCGVSCAGRRNVVVSGRVAGGGAAACTVHKRVQALYQQAFAFFHHAIAKAQTY